MANRGRDSFSHYPTADILKKWNYPNSFSSGFSVDPAFALGVASQGLETSNINVGMIVPAHNHYIVGVRLNLVSSSGGGFGGFTDLIKFLTGNGVSQIGLSWNAAGTFFLRRGSTTLVTATSTLALGTTAYVEVDCLCDGTSGVVSLYVNGTLFATFSGNTLISGGGLINGVALGSAVQFHKIHFSDFYVNDETGSINNGREYPFVNIKPILMASAGSFAQFKRGGVDTGSNVGQINEAIANAASYTQDNILGHRDSFVSAGVASITPKGASIWARVRADSAGARNIALTCESGATDSIGSNQVVIAAGSYLQRDISIDPNTGSLVTLTNLNAMKPGYKITL